jgi:hypothetical protein
VGRIFLDDRIDFCSGRIEGDYFNKVKGIRRNESAKRCKS